MLRQIDQRTDRQGRDSRPPGIPIRSPGGACRSRCLRRAPYLPGTNQAQGDRP